ncbi:pyrroline-5-carboxylate reductase [Kineothrix sp. MB12-C1]|uniref:pyrroline-5-carboxylate reductase n=1 Tax=Kineothrix sp. MB12-C1 TaxID=3070215 RepID=UPI0027D3175C|nr:pyrroline-5-carboxylate reductase [Kineothrix sp. MB12-C1]WMC94450.1 pyrroline-5-carboxylate reductase [Kineothrix sp. MB12-C1]
MKIGFIGLGNMAKAIIGGMLRENIVLPEDILGSAKTVSTMERIKEEFGIHVVNDNRQIAAESEVIVLAVKPIFFPEIIEEIKDEITSDKLIISIAAGKTMEWIEKSFAKEVKLIRCMPNTPALVGEGCTAVCTNAGVTKEEEEFCLRLMGSFGKAVSIPERLMDAAGAVSGSSPAYVFMFIEAMADGAVAAGMPRKQAYEFAAQAVLGAAKMVLETGIHPGELKDMVCSPGGTTIEGVRVLEERGMRSAIMEALGACVEKSQRL